MSEEYTEPIILDKSTTRKYETPEILEFIKENRNKGYAFSDITDSLRERGFEKITVSEVTRLYKSAKAKSIMTHNTAKEIFNDFTDELKTSYGEAVKIIAAYIRTMREVLDLLAEAKFEDEDGNLDLLKTKMNVTKTIQIAVPILKELREYSKFHADLQDTYRKEMEAQAWDETKIVEYINEYLPTLEKMGKIKILDRALKK